MQATITARAGEEITITTEHAASNYNQPVTVIDGEAYGVGDIAPALAPSGELDWLNQVPHVEETIADLLRRGVRNAHTVCDDNIAIGEQNRLGCTRTAVGWLHSDDCRTVRTMTA